MSEQFKAMGVPSDYLIADSDDEVRGTVKDRLVRRVINFVFVVDIYNEGVDIPEVTTVLFLRPTESLTVYLQATGTGLATKLRERSTHGARLRLPGTMGIQLRGSIQSTAASQSAVCREGDGESFSECASRLFHHIRVEGSEHTLNHIKGSVNILRN